MTTKTKKLATLLAVAVVLSSGAYALGTQPATAARFASSSSASAERGRQRRGASDQHRHHGAAPTAGSAAGRVAPGSPSSPRSSA